MAADRETVIDVKKARQVASHPTWIRANVPLPENAKVIPTLVTPCTHGKSGAMVHLPSVPVWGLLEFKEWAKRTLAVVRQVRASLVGAGDLAWRAEAQMAFESAGTDAKCFKTDLQQPR